MHTIGVKTAYQIAETVQLLGAALQTSILGALTPWQGTKALLLFCWGIASFKFTDPFLYFLKV